MGRNLTSSSMNSENYKKKTDHIKEVQKLDYLFIQLSSIRHSDPADERAQMMIAEWFELINDDSYSVEAFATLGVNYVKDPKFKRNIEQYGKGLPEFMCEAMKVYARNNTKIKHF